MLVIVEGVLLMKIAYEFSGGVLGIFLKGDRFIVLVFI